MMHTALTLADYEREAMAPAFYPNRGSNPGYTAFGLAGETAEVLESQGGLLG